MGFCLTRDEGRGLFKKSAAEKSILGAAVSGGGPSRIMRKTYERVGSSSKRERRVLCDGVWIGRAKHEGEER